MEYRRQKIAAATDAGWVAVEAAIVVATAIGVWCLLCLLFR